jgi:hypothetical protein
MWLQLITTLPNEKATARQRVWRALKSSGAVVLRDGVYLMPDRIACRTVFDEIASDVRGGGGSVWIFQVEEPSGENFRASFDRTEEYAALLTEITVLTESLPSANPAAITELPKQIRKLRRAFLALAAIDFFAGAAKDQTESALVMLEQASARILSPDEPQPALAALQHHCADDFQGRIWATRQRPWIDRLASGWLILRFIDRDARFIWLKRPEDCPRDAVGFDFDGATFTHVDSRVTFEVLMASFRLEQVALMKIATLVHYLDVGGVPPAEASGIETVLAGLRARVSDDDQLLAASFEVFDSLYAAFSGEAVSRGTTT